MKTQDEIGNGRFVPVKVTLYLKVLVKAGDDEDDVLEDVRCTIEDEVFDFDNIAQDGRYPTDIEFAD